MVSRFYASCGVVVLAILLGGALPADLSAQHGMINHADLSAQHGMIKGKVDGVQT